MNNIDKLCFKLIELTENETIHWVLNEYSSLNCYVSKINNILLCIYMIQTKYNSNNEIVLLLEDDLEKSGSVIIPSGCIIPNNVDYIKNNIEKFVDIINSQKDNKIEPLMINSEIYSSINRLERSIPSIHYLYTVIKDKLRGDPIDNKTNKTLINFNIISEKILKKLGDI